MRAIQELIVSTFHLFLTASSLTSTTQGFPIDLARTHKYYFHISGLQPPDKSMCMTASRISKHLARSSAFHAWSRNTRRIHTTSPLRLNRFLFDVNELDLQNVEDSTIENDDDKLHGFAEVPTVPTVTLPLADYRTIHAAKTLKLQNGDSIRAGIVLDRQEELPTVGVNESSATRDIASSHSHAIAGTVTDNATITWLPEGKIKKAEPTKNGNPPGSLRIQLNALHNPYVENRDEITEDGANVKSALDPSVSLILALPRPLQLERILPMISQMGVDHLVLCSAQKVPKDYFGSHLFRRPDELRSRLIEGLCQAGDVRLPKITVVRQLKKFIEDDLETFFPSSEVARVIAHPLRKDQAATRMRNVSFPGGAERRVVLAVGPEGGWSEPYELDLFKKHSFQQITLGSRVLRSDVAVVSLLGLAHDICTD